MTAEAIAGWSGNLIGAALPPHGVSALDLPIRWTSFRDFAAQSKAQHDGTLRGLMPLLQDTRAPAKSALPWLKLATFGDQRTESGSYRHNANVAAIYGIEADYDGESITIEHACQVLAQARVAAILYTSPSHTAERPRWRILCPTSKPLPPDARAALVARVNGLFVGALAAESFTLSQAYYYGHLDGIDAHQVVAVEGRPIDAADELDAEAVGRPQKAAPVLASAPSMARHVAALVMEGGTPDGRAALAEWRDRIRTASDGAKHTTIRDAGWRIGGLVGAGKLIEGEAWAALRDALAGLLPRCKDPKAAEKTLHKSFRDGLAKPQMPPEDDPSTPLAPAVHTLTAKLRAWGERHVAVQTPSAEHVDLMDVPGVVGMFVEHCERTARSPQPFLALAAGICLIGALAGRRYRSRTDARTNIYAVGVADSGGGKDHARKQVIECLHAAGLMRFLLGGDIASAAGLRTGLARHPAALFLKDEFGSWLSTVLGDKAPAHKAQIAADLREIWSTANGTLPGAEYADQSRQGRPREDIVEPHLCIYGTTTPRQLWAAVGGASLEDGLMARMLICQTQEDYPDKRKPAIAKPGPGLISALQAVAWGAGERPAAGGNLPAPHLAPMKADEAADPYTVPETPEAEAALEALDRHETALKRKHRGTWRTSIIGRLVEHTIKLALVRAVSRDPAAPVIEAGDVVWGRALAEHCINTMVREAGENVAETEYGRKTRRALSYIRKHGPITRRDLTRKGWDLPRREQEEILQSLLDSREIIALEISSGATGGHPTVRYGVNEGLIDP